MSNSTDTVIRSIWAFRGGAHYTRANASLLNFSIVTPRTNTIRAVESVRIWRPGTSDVVTSVHPQKLSSQIFEFEACVHVEQ